MFAGIFHGRDFPYSVDAKKNESGKPDGHCILKQAREHKAKELLAVLEKGHFDKAMALSQTYGIRPEIVFQHVQPVPGPTKGAVHDHKKFGKVIVAAAQNTDDPPPTPIALLWALWNFAPCEVFPVFMTVFYFQIFDKNSPLLREMRDTLTLKDLDTTRMDKSTLIFLLNYVAGQGRCIPNECGITIPSDKDEQVRLDFCKWILDGDDMADICNDPEVRQAIAWKVFAMGAVQHKKLKVCKYLQDKFKWDLEFWRQEKNKSAVLMCASSIEALEWLFSVYDFTFQDVEDSSLNYTAHGEVRQYIEKKFNANK